jgi:hypothetical protein
MKPLRGQFGKRKAWFSIFLLVFVVFSLLLGIQNSQRPSPNIANMPTPEITKGNPTSNATQSPIPSASLVLTPLPTETAGGTSPQVTPSPQSITPQSTATARIGGTFRPEKTPDPTVSPISTSTPNTIKGIKAGIFSDYNCTQLCTSLDWGFLIPNSNTTLLVFVRNEANSSSTLTYQVESWDPVACASFMTISWNYTGQTLSVGEVVPIAITLHVMPNISDIGKFSMDLAVVAENS